MTLASLQPGQSAKITRVKGSGPVSRRMADMGLVPGREVQLIRLAPLGDPLDLSLMGYRLSLRRDEALQVDVELLES